MRPRRGRRSRLPPALTRTALAALLAAPAAPHAAAPHRDALRLGAPRRCSRQPPHVAHSSAPAGACRRGEATRAPPGPRGGAGALPHARASRAGAEPRVVRSRSEHHPSRLSPNRRGAPVLRKRARAGQVTPQTQPSWSYCQPEPRHLAIMRNRPENNCRKSGIFPVTRPAAPARSTATHEVVALRLRRRPQTRSRQCGIARASLGRALGRARACVTPGRAVC